LLTQKIAFGAKMKDYYETALIILEDFCDELRNKRIFPRFKWKQGLLSLLNAKLRQQVPAPELIKHLNNVLNDKRLIKPLKKPPKPSKLFQHFIPKGRRLVLIDEAGVPRNKEEWGYFNENEEFILPANIDSMYYKLKEEEINRIIKKKRNPELDFYFEPTGYLRSHYSFISGVFNSENCRYEKI